MNHRLRFLHGLFICIAALVVPISIAAGVYFRTYDYPDESVTSELMQPPPFRRLMAKDLAMFGNLPVMANVRADSLNNLQLELDIKEPLEKPKLALFWSPERGTHIGMDQWKYVGPIYGTGMHRYRAPKDAADRQGEFVIASVLDGVEAGRGSLPRLELGEPMAPENTGGGDFDDLGL